jgi:hypothetical protein
MQLSISLAFFATFILLLFSSASFLAIGPPAAPILKNLGSANRFFEPGSEITLWNNYTRLDTTSNFTVVESGETAQSDSTWLTDPGFAHKVYYVFWFLGICLPRIDATC